MDNRLVHMLEGYLYAVFLDMRVSYGSKTRDWERDYKRSLHELRIRGPRMLTIDFPAVRKHFDQCLDKGLYIPSSLFLTGQVSGKVRVPAFLRVLYLQIFDTNGVLRQEPNIEAIANIRQFFETFGKLKDKCDDRYIRAEVRNFLENEADLRKPTLSWDLDDLYDQHDYPDSRLGLLDHHNGDHDRQLVLALEDREASASLSRGTVQTLHRVWDILASSLGDFHDDSSSFEDHHEDLLPQHGPGRVSNLRKDQSKFTFSDWPSKLERVFPFDRYGVVNLGHTPILDETARWPLNREHPSKLIAVPKTATGPRLIGSEPNYHVWVQQLVRLQLEHRVRSTVFRNCISFRDQSENGRLALESSRSGSHATVDLKSASDRLSCWAVERILRANRTLLERIHASRSRTMRNAIDDQFSIIRLKKCFTQGNACTFPVQTIIYSMIAIAAHVVSNDMAPTIKNIELASRNVRVFGDDIIVTKGTLPFLTEILSFLQLKVNLSKTFHHGKFRESCGVDAYDGVDVTPARIKQFSVKPSHEVLDSLIAASNNMWLKGMWNVSSWLTRMIPSHMLPIVPPRDSEGRLSYIKRAGLISYCGVKDSHLKSRWNPELQQQEVRVLRLTSNSKQVLTQSAYDLFDFHHRGSTKTTWFRTLYPNERKLGVVHKESSVMKTGWRAQNL